jgi:hypothetical protein
LGPNSRRALFITQSQRRVKHFFSHPKGLPSSTERVGLRPQNLYKGAG